VPLIYIEKGIQLRLEMRENDCGKTVSIESFKGKKTLTVPERFKKMVPPKHGCPKPTQDARWLRR
jgi:hypothetical protein